MKIKQWITLIICTVICLLEEIGFHVGARISESTLSFEDTAGKVDVNGWQYYFGIAFRF